MNRVPLHHNAPNRQTDTDWEKRCPTYCYTILSSGVRPAIVCYKCCSVNIRKRISSLEFGERSESYSKINEFVCVYGTIFLKSYSADSIVFLTQTCYQNTIKNGSHTAQWPMLKQIIIDYTAVT